jgi:HEPN domain-containing protein
MKRLTSEWIQKAEEDFFAACHLADAHHLTPFNVVCFHCQQAAEKWLKSRLCEDGVHFPKTHDLRQLLVLLEGSYPLWRGMTDQARRLSFFSTDTRYPGDSAAREDREQALMDVPAVRDQVRASFGLHQGRCQRCSLCAG